MEINAKLSICSGAHSCSKHRLYTWFVYQYTRRTACIGEGNTRATLRLHAETAWSAGRQARGQLYIQTIMWCVPTANTTNTGIKNIRQGHQNNYVIVWRLLDCEFFVNQFIIYLLFAVKVERKTYRFEGFVFCVLRCVCYCPRD